MQLIVRVEKQNVKSINDKLKNCKFKRFSNSMESWSTLLKVCNVTPCDQVVASRLNESMCNKAGMTAFIILKFGSTSDEN